MLPDKIGEFDLVNPEKVARALKGSIIQTGERQGGVAKEDGTWDDAELLAEYDKLGGLIRKGKDNVKMGSFYDFRNRKPRLKPEVFFVFHVNGKVVEVPESAELPGIVKAVKILEEERVADIEAKLEKKAVKSKKVK